MRLTFWRPQRRTIPPETGQWIDMGGLNYSASGGFTGGPCPQDAFTELGPNVRPLESNDVFPFSYDGVKDLAADQAPSTDNTFTYKLNLTRCLAAAGLSFNPGESWDFSFAARGATATGDTAIQMVSFERK